MAQIILDYLTVLVWPITVVLLLVKFRTQLLMILGKINKIKVGDVEVGFDEVEKLGKALQKSKDAELNEDTKKSAERIADTTDAKGASQISGHAEGTSTATANLTAKDTAPPRDPAHFKIASYLRQNLTARIKIIESWDALEYSVRQAAEQAKIITGFMPFFALLKIMETEYLLNDDDIELLKKMRELINRIAAEEVVVVSNSQMSSFVSFADDMATYLINNIIRAYPDFFTEP